MPARQEQGSRPLEFSDVVSEQHAAILADPYGFLGVPQDSPLDVVRTAYINQAKRYHPDMIHPTLDSDEKIMERFVEAVTADPEGFRAGILAVSQVTDDEEEEKRSDRAVFDHMSGFMGMSGDEAERRHQAKLDIQAMAHTRMVELNVAYEAIKQQINPRIREVIAGYRIIDMMHEGYNDGLFHEDSRGPYQQIDLEGQGRVVIYPNTFFHGDPYEIPGAYLEFDWAPPRDHNWMVEETDFQGSIYVKNLFIHHELQEGGGISPVLINPFFERLQLSSAQRELFVKLLKRQLSWRSAESIMEEIGIPPATHSRVMTEEFLRSLSFERNVNQMIFLQAFDPSPWPGYENSMRFEGGSIVLTGQTESILTPTDVMLLTTLAYGPLIQDQ